MAEVLPYFENDYDLLWWKVGHNGPEETTYVEQELDNI